MFKVQSKNETITNQPISPLRNGETTHPPFQTGEKKDGLWPYFLFQSINLATLTMNTKKMSTGRIDILL